MDWLNFFMKHGIGTPRSMAKAQGKVYMMLRKRYPDAPEDEILRTMFVQRARIGLATGCRDAYAMIEAPGWADAVVRSNPDLLSLAVYIILCEHPELRRADAPDDLFPRLVGVVAEALDEVAPLWRRHFSGVLDPETGGQRPPTPSNKVVEAESEETRHALSVACPNCGLPNDDLHPERVNHRLFVGRYQCGGCLTTIDYRIVIHDPFSPNGLEIVAEEAPEDGEPDMVEDAGASDFSTAPDLPVLQEIAPSLMGHEGRVNRTRFSADGRFILSCGTDRTIRLWDTTTRRQLRLLETAKPVEAVTFIPGTRTVASADGPVIRLWDLQTAREVSILGGHETDVCWLEADASGKTIFSADSDTIRIWDAHTGREQRRFVFENELFMAVGFSSEGAFAIVGGDDLRVRLFDIRSAKIVRAFEGHTMDVTTIAIGPGGKLCLIGSLDMTCSLWEVSSGQLVSRLRGFTHPVGAVAFSPDGDLAVVAGDSPSAWIWDLTLGRPLCALQGNTLGIATAVFSPNGKFVLTGGYDGSVRLWDVSAVSGLGDSR